MTPKYRNRNYEVEEKYEKIKGMNVRGNAKKKNIKRREA